MASHLSKKTMQSELNKSEDNAGDSCHGILEIEYVKLNDTRQNNMLSVLYHFVMTVFYTSLVYHSTTLVTKGMPILDPDRNIPSTGGYFKFLTHTNQWLQLFFFSFSVFY